MVGLSGHFTQGPNFREMESPTLWKGPVHQRWPISWPWVWYQKKTHSAKQPWFWYQKTTHSPKPGIDPFLPFQKFCFGPTHSDGSVSTTTGSKTAGTGTPTWRHRWRSSPAQKSEWVKAYEVTMMVVINIRQLPSGYSTSRTGKVDLRCANLDPNKLQPDDQTYVYILHIRMCVYII